MKLNAIFEQIERETSRRGGNEGAGRIPAVVGAISASVYKWDRMNRLIRSWAGLPETVDGEALRGRKNRCFREENEYPAIVDRFASLKIEMMMRARYRVLGARVWSPDAPDSVEDHYPTFEWGSGGMALLRSLLLISLLAAGRPFG